MRRIGLAVFRRLSEVPVVGFATFTAYRGMKTWRRADLFQNRLEEMLENEKPRALRGATALVADAGAERCGAMSSRRLT